MHTNLPIENSIALGDERLAFLNNYTENLGIYLDSIKSGADAWLQMHTFAWGLKLNYSELIETLVSNREPLIEE
jgi:hypothetical protein